METLQLCMLPVNWQCPDALLQGPVRDAVKMHGAAVASISEADLRPVVIKDFQVRPIPTMCRNSQQETHNLIHSCWCYLPKLESGFMEVVQKLEEQCIGLPLHTPAKMNRCFLLPFITISAISIKPLCSTLPLLIARKALDSPFSDYYL